MKHLLILATLGLFAIACVSKKKENPPVQAPAELAEIQNEAEAVQPPHIEEPPPVEKKKKVSKRGKNKKMAAKKSQTGK